MLSPITNMIESVSIEDWCRKLHLVNYEIIDGVVNCNANANISGIHYLNITHKSYKRIPIQFGIVTGNFVCNYNKLITLEGGPKKVGCDYYCDHNKLISLEGGPNKLDGIFYCNSNPVFEEYCKYDSYNHYMRYIKMKSILC